MIDGYPYKLQANKKIIKTLVDANEQLTKYCFTDNTHFDYRSLKFQQLHKR